MDPHVDPALLAFLRDPASYPHGPQEIRELHTHASLVFVVPPFVYKIKKPVDFGFLDFSTVEKRRSFLPARGGTEFAARTGHLSRRGADHAGRRRFRLQAAARWSNMR